MPQGAAQRLRARAQNERQLVGIGDTGGETGREHRRKRGRETANGGVVVAEFVVDTTGRVEPETFSVVSSPHLLFSHAVYEAIAPARFTPARRGGRSVRQVVQMRFRFTPPGGHE